MNFFAIPLFILLFALLPSCIANKSNAKKVSSAGPYQLSKINSGSVSSVSIVNNQLFINGDKLYGVNDIKINGTSFNESFTIQSVSVNQIIANANRALSFDISKVFSLVLSDAFGSVIYPISFDLPSGSVTSPKLNSMGAVVGQVLKFDGSNWVPSTLSNSQIYLGNYNASSNTPNLNATNPVSGDYYVVSVAGTYNGVAYAVGDWIISDGFTWQKIPYSNTLVSSFQGRKGIVTLQPADYVSLKDTITSKITGSSINDFANVDLTTVAPLNGYVFKYNGSKWVASPDNSGISAGTGSIVDADISTISQSKVTNLVSDLSTLTTGKQNISSLAADVRLIPLTGLTSAAGTIVATDSILGAFGKLMNSQTDYVSKSGSTTISGTFNFTNPTSFLYVQTPTGTTATEVANVQYVTNAIGSNGVWTKSDTTINYSTGNVGIGVAAPASKLEVNGDVRVSSGHITTGNNKLYRSYDGSGNLIDLLGISTINDTTLQTSAALGSDLIYSVNSTDGKHIFKTKNGIEKLRIDENGLVGIGTGATTPLEQLHLVGNMKISSDTLDTYGATISTSAVYGNLVLKAKSNSKNGFVFGSDSTGTLFRVSDTTYAQNYLNIIAGGNVGIGTSAPSGSLSVTPAQYSTGTASQSTTTVTGSGTTWTSAMVGSQFVFANGVSAGTITAFVDANNLTVSTSQTIADQAYKIGYTGLQVASNGNVGIGTTAPGSRMDVKGDGTNPISQWITSTGTVMQKIGINGGTIIGKVSGDVDTGANLRVINVAAGDNAVAIRGAASPTGDYFQINSSGASANAGDIFKINSSGNVGIGTAAPNVKAEISAVTNAANQNNGIRISTTGAVATAAYRYSDLKLKSDAGGVFRTTIDVNDNGTTAAKEAVSILQLNGNVGIGNTAPGKLLHVGSATVGTGVAVANFQNVDGTCTITPAAAGSGIACSSDERLKENFQDVQGVDVLDRILKLQAVTYNFKTASTETRRTGYKAQEVQKVAPEFVRQDDNGFFQVYYDGLIPWITEAIKTLYNRIIGIETHQATQDRAIASIKADKAKMDAKIQNLETENAQLKKDNAAIKSRLDKIEKALNSK